MLVTLMLVMLIWAQENFQLPIPCKVILSELHRNEWKQGESTLAELENFMMDYVLC